MAVSRANSGFTDSIGWAGAGGGRLFFPTWRGAHTAWVPVVLGFLKLLN